MEISGVYFVKCEGILWVACVLFLRILKIPSIFFENVKESWGSLVPCFRNLKVPCDPSAYFFKESFATCYEKNWKDREDFDVWFFKECKKSQVVFLRRWKNLGRKYVSFFKEFRVPSDFFKNVKNLGGPCIILLNVKKPCGLFVFGVWESWGSLVSFSRMQKNLIGP